MVPTAVRQPESHGALAAKHKLVRKRYQKLGDLTEIINTITNRVTNLSNWWTELTLAGEEKTWLLTDMLSHKVCFFTPF